uniref:V-type proton ATPase subunit E n=1 Tax=Megaselia scalaris TaxID=36166 RepID=T1H6F6_MEGSC
NIEKGRLVQQQRLKIMEYYEKKEKQVELQKKIQSSNMLNQARLKVLKVREDHVRSVLDEARRRLGEVTKNQAEYRQILQKLIVQALYQTMEKNVTLRIRRVDENLIREIIPDAAELYKSNIGKDININIDTDHPPNTCGGVEVIALNGRVKVPNTLESRLELICQQLVPETRNALFGVNPNRKFTD